MLFICYIIAGKFEDKGKIYYTYIMSNKLKRRNKNH